MQTTRFSKKFKIKKKQIMKTSLVLCYKDTEYLKKFKYVLFTKLIIK